MRPGRRFAAVVAIVIATAAGAAGCTGDSSPTSPADTQLPAVGTVTATAPAPEPTTAPEGVVVAVLKIAPRGGDTENSWDQTLLPSEGWGGIEHTQEDFGEGIGVLVTGWGNEYPITAWTAYGAHMDSPIEWREYSRGADRITGLLVRKEFPLGAIFFTVPSAVAEAKGLEVYNPCRVMLDITTEAGMTATKFPPYCAAA